MKLEKSFECVKGGKHQILTISCNPKHRDDLEGLGLDDFDVNLYLGGRHIAEVSHLLDKAELLESLIEKTDWHQLWAETKIEEAEYRRDIYKEMGEIIKPAI